MKKYSTLSLRWKLLSGFGCIALVLVCLGVISNWAVKQLKGQLDYIGNEQMTMLESSLNMSKLLTKLSLEMQVFLNPESTRADRQAATDKIQVLRGEYAQVAKTLEAMMVDEKDIAIYDKFLEVLNPWKTANNDIVAGNETLLSMDMLDPSELIGNLEDFKSDHYAAVIKALKNLQENHTYTGGIDHTACRYGKWSREYDGSNPVVRQVIAKAADPHKEFHQSVNKIQKHLASNDQDAARAEIFNGLIPKTEEMTSYLVEASDESNKAHDALVEMSRIRQEVAKGYEDQGLAALDELSTARMENSHQEVANSLNFAQKINGWMTLATLISVVVSMIIGYVFGNSLSKRLAGIAERITGASSETNAAATQVSTSSTSLAEGASEQAASLEETSSSMEEMTSMVARNAELASATTEQAMAANDAVQSGVGSMQDLRKGVDAAGQSANELSEAMEAIKQSSDNISKIISTIDEIAFQTNILALNAAVEAARAGEAGAGFAVVADEVRSLARRAAGAASETQSLIEDSVKRSERGVVMNQNVNERLKEVLRLAGAVDSSLSSIAENGSKVAQSMNELQSSSAEQQDGINQINTTVGQVNEVTQANAASAEEAASAAEELNAQAESLMEVVSELNHIVKGGATQDISWKVQPEVSHKRRQAVEVTSGSTRNGDFAMPEELASYSRR